MDVTVVQEMPLITLASAINNLGGALSLFLGISFIMLFEWVELVIKLIYSAVCQFF